ncbi:hypothetical protein V5799_006336 [Amblyomma americanum]|uniref:Uncharacterized protein n=1 Tax=Amblyomma americanum TaxID=6943 RepID=A0AAQ4DWN9_AMBAM
MSLSLFGAVMLLVSAWLSAVEILSGISSVLGCILISIIVLLAGLICVADIYLMVRHHHQALIQWRQNNWGVRLVLPNSLPEVAGSADARGLPLGLPPPPPSEPPTPLSFSLNSTTAASSDATTTTSAATQQDWQATNHLVA